MQVVNKRNFFYNTFMLKKLFHIPYVFQFQSSKIMPIPINNVNVMVYSLVSVYTITRLYIYSLAWVLELFHTRYLSPFPLETY